MTLIIGIFSTIINELKSTPGLTFEVSGNSFVKKAKVLDGKLLDPHHFFFGLWGHGGVVVGLQWFEALSQPWCCPHLVSLHPGV